MSKKPCTGEIVVINGKKWCIGERIISKWKHSKRNKKYSSKKKRKVIRRTVKASSKCK